jgi:hypothetical protein
MLRILAKISIFGTKSAVQQLGSTASMENGDIQQVGIARPKPDVDFWCYGSLWYRFRLGTFDDELLDFLETHKSLGDALTAVRSEVKYALCTVCPVEQTDEEVFACIFGDDTLSILTDLGLSLEIAPASVMPDVPYWLTERG